MYTEEDLQDHHAVSAVIKDSKGNILMQDHVKYGFWTIPIGKAKPGQDPVEAIKEEVFEECNLVIESLKEITFKDTVYERDGKMVQTYVHNYEVLSYSGELENKEPQKHKEQKFVPLEEIKKRPYLSDSTIAFLETLGFKRNAKLEEN